MLRYILLCIFIASGKSGNDNICDMCIIFVRQWRRGYQPKYDQQDYTS